MNYLIHDIKSERQNVSGGLPAGYKLIPVLFYLVSAGSIVLSAYFYLSKKAYETAESDYRNRISQAQSEEGSLQAKQKTIVTESKKAEVVAKWLEGSRPLQPVTVVIGRSINKDSTIAELSLERNPDIPAHTFMQFKVDGAGAGQIESSLDSIYALGYETYSAQQVKGEKSTDFQATLIHKSK